MLELWNGLLTGLGSALAFFYSLLPSYVVAIMLLTVAVRVILLPLTIKQVRSMQAMQKLQPKMKELQRKYKGNRQKLNEEMMKLYKEHQVNPLGGCLPLLLQLPVFFALFRVLTAASAGALPGTRYLPQGSTLLGDLAAQKAGFLGINLACTPVQAGRGAVELVAGAPAVNCGGNLLVALPVYLLVALMVGTTFYQQRQMQRVSGGMQAQQMVLMTKIMPIFLGVISINISSGVLVYWVTTNVWQIVQQYVMLRSRAVTPSAAGTDGIGPKERKPQAELPPKSKASGQASASKSSNKPPNKSKKSGTPGKSAGGRNARGRKKRSKR